MDLCNPDYNTCLNGGECSYEDYDVITCDCAEGTSLSYILVIFFLCTVELAINLIATE